MKWLGGIAIVVLSFFISLWIMNYFSPPCPQGERVALRGPYQKFPAPGVAYIASLPSWDALSDSSDNPTRSNVAVCESNRLLGPTHSIHQEIAEKGQGRFSHWKAVGFVFSSTDNSDPNLNGRQYWAVRPN